MSKSTTNKDGDTFNTQNNVEEIPSKQSNSLIERKQIEGTPFTMIKEQKDKYNNWFIVMGDHRLTEPTRTEQEQLSKLVNEYWKIVVNVVAIVNEKIMKQWLEDQKNIDYIENK